ncbi:MAG: glycoside hydrolase family 65 protein, partial [Bacilli bacterium]|nr:glycoside hydrolase family 65 protein [Bacilli bacterium]
YVKKEGGCTSFNQDFDDNYKMHATSFNKKWENAYVEIDDESQFDLSYSIYHLLILEDMNSYHSIPARGVSGQTYKGAIFWDTEIFILPFFTLTNPKFARNLIKYRIDTLEGAKQKAKSFGFDGAFYAWESQEDGLERCSKYNVTDPITNQPIRTYFDEKQIHISADISLAIERYYDFTLDESIFVEGGYNIVYECLKFYISRATLRDNKYHFDDVIGPDEYHERVNDNAFTNYMVYENARIALKYFDKYVKYTDKSLSKDKINEFINKIYLPKPNKDGVIEQFDGYFKLQDKKPHEVLKMRKNNKEYLGHLAMNTKTIKQADVITLLIIAPHHDLSKYLRSNYDYYYPYTEHGSSLSASMYSLSASKLKIEGDAYHLFKKSAHIDLGIEQKMYAGGIYIGGTHPASNAGAYLSVVLGFAGLTFDEDEIKVNPSLPNNVSGLKFKIIYRDKKYLIEIKKDRSYLIKEETL